MKPHSDSAFSDSSLKSLFKTNDILVSDGDEVSNHEFYNLIDKIDMNKPPLPFKKFITANFDKELNMKNKTENFLMTNVDKEQNLKHKYEKNITTHEKEQNVSKKEKLITTINDKEQILNNKDERFKYKPRFLFNKYDDPGHNSENKISADIENMDKMANRMKNMIDEMQLKKIISLTAVLKSNQIGAADTHRASKELVKNVLDVEIPKQINKIVGSRSAADELEKLSTELFLLGVVGDEADKDDVNQADDEMSDTNVNQRLSIAQQNAVIRTNALKDDKNDKSLNIKLESLQLNESDQDPLNIQSKNKITNLILPNYSPHVVPIFPRKMHTIEKRIKLLEKLMKKLKLNVKSLQKRVHSTPHLCVNNTDTGEGNKENSIGPTKLKLYSSTRTLGLTSNCSSRQMENPYDELFYEFRQRKMNLLHYKKSERSLLFNQYPILKWNKPVLNFATEDYKVQLENVETDPTKANKIGTAKKTSKVKADTQPEFLNPLMFIEEHLESTENQFSISLGENFD